MNTEIDGVDDADELNKLRDAMTTLGKQTIFTLCTKKQLPIE